MPASANCTCTVIMVFEHVSKGTCTEADVTDHARCYYDMVRPMWLEYVDSTCSVRVHMPKSTGGGCIRMYINNERPCVCHDIYLTVDQEVLFLRL